MDSELQDNTISSTVSLPTDEQLPVNNDATNLPIQAPDISSTTTSDVEAMMLSLIGFD